MRLSVVIPAYNESRRLPATLAAISGYLEATDLDVEVIVVDDGSTDGTAEAVRAMPGKGMPPKLTRFEANRGKGAAVREGLLAATGDYVLFMDADNSTRINEVEKLLQVAQRGTPVVIGSRHLDGDSIKIKQPWYRVGVSRLGNRLIQLVILPGVRDTQCGFKLLDGRAAHDIARLLTLERWSFDMELLVVAKQLGLEIREVPVNWYDTPGTRLRPIKASFQTLLDLLRIKCKQLRGRYPDEPQAGRGA